MYHVIHKSKQNNRDGGPTRASFPSQRPYNHELLAVVETQRAECSTGGIADGPVRSLKQGSPTGDLE